MQQRACIYVCLAILLQQHAGSYVLSSPRISYQGVSGRHLALSSRQCLVICFAASAFWQRVELACSSCNYAHQAGTDETCEASALSCGLAGFYPSHLIAVPDAKRH